MLLLVLCLAVQGCGTDAFHLLKQDEELTWQVELDLAEAEGLPPGIEEALDRAAIAKSEACRPIYRNIKYRMDRAVMGERPSLAKAFGKDFMLLIARIAPIGPVASCAAAFDQFHAEYLLLRQHIERDQTAY